MSGPWVVGMVPEFEAEFDSLQEHVRLEILAQARRLKQFGPRLGRPKVDTQKGSRYPNMKELRVSVADGEWRVAFAFDPARRAMLLVAGNKSGVSQRHFYQGLIHQADQRYGVHLGHLKKGD